MTEEKKPSRLEKVERDNPGIFTNMSRTVRLVFRLMMDRRVNFFLKLLPIGALVYMAIPELIPVVDDVVILGLGTYVFVELCPQDVVQEHRDQLAGLEETGQAARDKNKVIDGLFKDRDQE